MTKVLLINSPVSIYINKTAFLPLPLLVLGTCLKEIKENGVSLSYEVIDLDFMLKKGDFSDDPSFYQQAGDLILEKKPDIILFTVHGLNHVVVLKLSERIKQERPSCTIVAGGVGPTLMAKEALARCEQIDVIVKGEGETVLKHLIPAIIGNGNFGAVPSAVYRKNSDIMENPRLSLDKNAPIPFPDYSLVPIEDYIAHNKKHPYIHPGFVPVESGRGCPHRCLFCAPAKMWGNTARYRPISDIIEEMKFLAGKGGNFSFFTQDNLEEKFLRTFSEALIKEQVNISWGCYSRLDQLSESMAILLSTAGCRMIFTGFETPNRMMQKTIRKVVNSSATFQKLQIFNASKISLIGSFIAGFTGESEEDLDHTMRFAIECATGLTSPQLNEFVAATDHDKLPSKGSNICAIHPLSYMPGTDSFAGERENLHISRYSMHPDCYGSYLFSYDEFKDDWSFLGGNPYLNHLPEERVRFYCSILRLFNLLNSRPYYFTLLLQNLEQGPLALMKRMATHLGEEFILTARIDEFETQVTAFVRQHLTFVPQWTVKKGQ